MMIIVSIILLFFTFLSSIVLTPFVRWFAHKKGLLDTANARKVHTTPTPRLGGLAMMGAFWGPLVWVLLRSGWPTGIQTDSLHPFVGLLVGGMILLAVGAWDDVAGMRARNKLVGQVLVALLVCFLGYRLRTIASPWGTSIELGVLGLPLSVLWIVGIINAMNLIDGLDGLAGGVAALALLGFALMGIAIKDPFMTLVSAGMLGAVLGFLAFNVHPASIFMGDTGSMFLGFILATMSIRLLQGGPQNGVPVWTPLMLLGLPIADTILAICRRLKKHCHPFRPDREHIHHKLLDLGHSVKESTLILWLLSLALFVTSFLGAISPHIHSIFLFLGTVVGMLVVFVRWGIVGNPLQGLSVARTRPSRRRRASITYYRPAWDSMSNRFPSISESLAGSNEFHHSPSDVIALRDSAVHHQSVTSRPKVA